MNVVANICYCHTLLVNDIVNLLRGFLSNVCNAHAW